MIQSQKKEMRKVSTDVLVVGGGTAGFAAAIAAARSGSKVILLEQYDYLGGTMTGGQVNMIRSMRHMIGPKDSVDRKLKLTTWESSFADKQLVFSLAQEFVDRMLDVGSAWGTKGQAATRQFFDPERAKMVIEKMVTEAGVDIWYYSQCTDVIRSGDTIKGVVVEKLLERIEIEAKVTIDATGDGDIAAAMGATFDKGTPDDGVCQPLTLYFSMGNVNLDKTFEYMKANSETLGKEYVEKLIELKKEGKPLTLSPFKPIIKEAVSKGDYPIPYGLKDVYVDSLTYIIRPQVRSGKMRYDFLAVNMDMAYNVDATDKKALTKAMIAMREYAVKMVDFHRKYVSGFEDAYLCYTAPLVGIRDTRRIIGDYFLTGDDVLSGKSFEDGIGRYGSVVDVHDKEGGKKETILTEIGGQGWFHIPYRIMLPKGVDNLLIAGRCVSADFVAQGCTRSEAACILTGQAAGTSAVMSIKAGIKPRDVNIKELQAELAKQNQII